MSRIKVCQLITELAPAGAERCVYELATRLNRERFDVQVMGLRGGKMADWLAAAGVKVTVAGIRGKWDVAKVYVIADHLKREGIDLLHTHLFHADLAGRLAANMAAVPHLVHTVHVAEGRFRPWRFTFARLMAGRCERIVCVSPSVRDDHARRAGLPHSAYTVIPNGIDADAYSRDDLARADYRRQWGVTDDEVVLAFIGRLDPQKGIATLLSAMSHLAARGRAKRLVIAGTGPKRSQVTNFIAHGEGGSHCAYLGFVADVRGVLSAADVLVMPSEWEGFGLAAGEAMAAGLPVIASRAVGLKNLVVADETALVIDRGDVVALSEAIERLADDGELRQRLGRAGRRRIVENFSIDAMVAGHERLYAEVTGRGTATF